MKMPLVGIGVALIAIGGIWFFQGIGVLPGSFMSGDRKWAVIGGICVAVGVGLIVFARRG